jgi:cytochrome c-type biogenesis protein CcmH
MAAALAFMLALGVAAPAAVAVEPDEMLDDPTLEQRAREISRDLRCVVCQNENIDESNADMARDMRILVRDRLLEGDTNQDVKQYLVDRYGDYVLLQPPFKPTTYVLWFGPALILLAAAGTAFAFYRRKAAAPPTPPPLSAAEQARLNALLTDPGDPDADREGGDGAGPNRGGAA